MHLQQHVTISSVLRYALLAQAPLGLLVLLSAMCEHAVL